MVEEVVDEVQNHLGDEIGDVTALQEGEVVAPFADVPMVFADPKQVVEEEDHSMVEPYVLNVPFSSLEEIFHLYLQSECSQ